MDNAACVFCDRAQFEERLCGETDGFWVVATLGQITDGGYLLLIPKAHITCFGAMENAGLRSLENLYKKIKDVFANEYNCASPTVFEHGIVGQSVKHAHLHLIPASLAITKKVTGDFTACNLALFPNFHNIGDLYQLHPEPYLLWLDSANAQFKALLDPQNVPMQYMRLVIAEVLGRKERANWRTMDAELDKKLWSETVQKLKPHF